MVYGYSCLISLILSKKNNFCYFLFASVFDIAFPKWGQALKDRICSLRSKFFSLRVDPHWEKEMDGWMTCDFTSFLTVFQSYQDDVQMIMKGCVQWTSVYSWEDFTSSEDPTRSARSVGQGLTHWATGAPIEKRGKKKIVQLLPLKKR